jgi:hypothetical protein
MQANPPQIANQIKVSLTCRLPEDHSERPTVNINDSYTGPSRARVLKAASARMRNSNQSIVDDEGEKRGRQRLVGSR